MAYNPYSGQRYGPPQNYNPYPGAGHPSFGPPPGMSPAPGMPLPPGIPQPHSATQANRQSGFPPSFQPPPNMPNINFNAPVIRLGGTVGGGAASLPARPNMAPGPYGRREPDTSVPAASSNGGGMPMRPDFRNDRFGSGGMGGIGANSIPAVTPGSGGGVGSGNNINSSSSGGGATHAVPSTQAPQTNDEKLRTIFVHKVPADVGGNGKQTLQQLLRLVGRLQWWDVYESHLADHKGELFGFAQYEDADSLASALELLKDVQVPLKKQEPRDAPPPMRRSGGGKDSKKSTNTASEDETAEKAAGPAERNTNGPADEDADGSSQTAAPDKEDAAMADGGDAAEGSDKDGDSSDDNDDDPYKDIERTPLQVAYDPVSLKYIEVHRERQSDEAKAEAKARQTAYKEAFQAAIHALFFPSKETAAQASNGDVKMTDAGGSTAGADGGTEVVTIPLAQQEDELADIPAEMREIVAAEIASFRERSNQKDLERLKREQELEEVERRRNGEENSRLARLGSPVVAAASSSSGAAPPPSGPRGGGGLLPARTMEFVNGGMANGGGDDGPGQQRRRRRSFDDPDTDASDEELYERERRRQQAEDEKLYQEVERKWVNRERQRAAALEREKDRDRSEAERAGRHRAEQLERERAWDDEREAGRKTVLYYRDHAAWQRKRAHERAEEAARDAADRRAEAEEQRRQAAEMETARGMADSFLEQQAGVLVEKREEKEKEKKAAADEASAAPQRVTISFGAAAQRNQAQRGGAGRQLQTVAEVEGLLDDEEQEGATKRPLVPIEFEPMAASARLSDEELGQAVRALAQEIPTTRSGLWAWAVAWAYLDEAMLRDKLRPFVEKKVVEYLGVQEQFLVEVVEAHLRAHGGPQALVEELQEALDEAAEDLVRKLWRMVIFFTESEKRGLPA